MKRLKAGSRYNKDLLAKCSARPWHRLVQSEPRAVSIAMPVIAPMPPEEVGRGIWKRVFIKMSDLVTHGYTECCPGCDAARVDALARNHEACRDRLTTLITTSSDAVRTSRMTRWRRQQHHHHQSARILSVQVMTSWTTRRQLRRQLLECWVGTEMQWLSKNITGQWLENATMITTSRLPTNSSSGLSHISLLPASRQRLKPRRT